MATYFETLRLEIHSHVQGLFLNLTLTVLLGFKAKGSQFSDSSMFLKFSPIPCDTWSVGLGADMIYMQMSDSCIEICNET